MDEPSRQRPAGGVEEEVGRAFGQSEPGRGRRSSTSRRVAFVVVAARRIQHQRSMSLMVGTKAK